MQLAPPTGSHGNPITIEIESDALMVLSCLCENNIHRKVTKSSVIIAIIIIATLYESQRVKGALVVYSDRGIAS